MISTSRPSTPTSKRVATRRSHGSAPSAFSGKAGQLHIIDQGSQVIVQGDIDGDRKADFDILVKVGTLSAGDFIA